MWFALKMMLRLLRLSAVMLATAARWSASVACCMPSSRPSRIMPDTGSYYSADITLSRWPILPSTTRVPSTSSITRQASCEVLSLTS